MKTITCQVEDYTWESLHRIAKDKGLIFRAYIRKILEDVVVNDIYKDNKEE